MKKIEEMTAEEALREWKHAKSQHDILVKSGYPSDGKKWTDICASRLDQLAEEYGISLGEYGFEYRNMLDRENGTRFALYNSLCKFVPAMEQQAIQNWLLRKAGLK